VLHLLCIIVIVRSLLDAVLIGALGVPVNVRLLLILIIVIIRWRSFTLTIYM
jgi:hypothetical protein